MKRDEKYIVESFIEADITSADALKTCHASSSGVTGVDVAVGNARLVDVAKKAVRDHDRRRWLESFLERSAGWSAPEVQGARARYQIRAKVHVRSAEGMRTVGECAYEENRSLFGE